MRRRSSRILFVGFGSLVLLIGLSGLGAARRASKINSELASIYSTYRECTRILQEIRAELNLSGIYVRDYLLDPSDLTAELHRRQLLEIREHIESELAELEKLIGPDQSGTLAEMKRELDAYWQSWEPLFNWSPRQKLALSSFFLRQRVLPRRDAVLAVADGIRKINEANFQIHQQRLALAQANFRRYLWWMLGVAITLGVVVAGISIFRINRLEQESEQQQARTELAERELRRLSRELVRAQEAERRSISRELHDEVGQMLTALRMELSNLEDLPSSAPEVFRRRLAEAKQLVEQTLVCVRNLAIGLRPPMLDDLGLAPALEWQGREFSRRSGIQVDILVEGELDDLPDVYRTSVFRIVQEALTNCARHANASRVRITVHGSPEAVFVGVQDDGQGLPAGGEMARGLGLIGIEERARELGGRMSIQSQSGRGTTLTVEIPRPKGAAV